MLSMIGGSFSRLGWPTIVHFRARTTDVLHPAFAAHLPNFQVREFQSGRSRRGLYDGKDVRSGNKISHAGNKSKRKWKPNVQHKTLYSELLDRKIKFHLTASTLRSVDKAGGIDNYLFKNEFKEGEGWYWKGVMKRYIKNRKKWAKKDALRAAEAAAMESAETPPGAEASIATTEAATAPPATSPKPEA